MLSLRDLHFRYPGAPQAALCGVTFDVAHGQIVGLLGPNGAGKTTLISHLAGLLPLQHGHIDVDGAPLQQCRRKDPSRIAIAPQEYAFYPTLTVRENLACFAAVSSSRYIKQRVERALAFAQLERFARQAAHTLSGGLKRRLNLAIATLSDPHYILLDEPTAGVDPQSRAFLLDAVRALAQSGVGIVYTSHYMEEVETLADCVVIIDHGSVLRQGSLDELLGQGQPVLKFAQAGLDDDRLQAVLRDYGTLQSSGQLLLGRGHTPSQALGALERAGAQVTHAEFGRFNLEQLFMQLTHRSLRD